MTVGIGVCPGDISTTCREENPIQWGGPMHHPLGFGHGYHWIPFCFPRLFRVVGGGESNPAGTVRPFQLTIRFYVVSSDRSFGIVAVRLSSIPRRPPS